MSRCILPFCRFASDPVPIRLRSGHAQATIFSSVAQGLENVAHIKKDEDINQNEFKMRKYQNMI